MNQTLSLLAALLCCALFTPEGLTAQPLSDDELLDMGIEAYNRGDYENGLRYLFAYRMRVPEPGLLAEHPDFADEVDEAIATSMQRLRERVEEIEKLEDRLADLTGTRVIGRENMPPKLEKPTETAGAAREVARPPAAAEILVEITEDCLPFEPGAMRLSQEGESWLLSSGNSRMMLFGERREAVTAARTIRYYGMNRHCFVGRPDASTEYFLVDGGTPEGEFSGEDCVSFTPDALSMRDDGGRWTLVEGNHSLLAFPNSTEAQHTLRVIRKHGFTRLCFVGRPDPSMTYFRK